MSKQKRRFEEAVRRMASRFPGVLWCLVAQFPELMADTHSLLHGETIRWRFMLRVICRARREGRKLKWDRREIHHVILRKLHDFFVGEPRQPWRKHAAMYRGARADFEHDCELWWSACVDVESAYEHLLRYQPRRVILDGDSRDLHHLLQRPAEVTATHDLVKLIELAWSAGDGLHERLVRHHAGLKLILGQFYFELRRQGVAPEDWEQGMEELNHFIQSRLLGIKPKEKAERVFIQARLDSKKNYSCRSWQILPEGAALPRSTRTRVVVPAMQYHLTVGAGGKKIPLFYFIRVKREPVLKALKKGIRFTKLTGIGDNIGIMIVVEHEHLDEVVRQARRVLVPCPGQVFDQASTIGDRKGHRLDRENGKSSRNYEAMKYIASLFDLMAEVQFKSVKAWLDEHFTHNRVNHGLYKLDTFLESVLPFLFPEPITGIPWQDPKLREQCQAHVLSHENNGFL